MRTRLLAFGAVRGRGAHRSLEKKPGCSHNTAKEDAPARPNHSRA